MWSTSGYGLFVDSEGGAFDISGDNLNFTNSSKKDVNYFVMVGDGDYE